MTSTAVDSGRIVIACASDEHYVRPLAAMLQSVAENLHAERSAEVYVFQSGISEKLQRDVSRSWPPDRLEAHWITADASSFAGLPLWGRMPVATYFKLAIPDLLPDSVAKAIWLDCDLIVMDDVAKLWDQDISSAHAGAVQDSVVPLVSSACGIRFHQDLGIDPNAKYFNAGVMVVDVAAWRRDEIRRRATEYLRRYHESVTFWDQEGLNAALAGKWVEIGSGWNHNASIPGKSARGKATPSIVHFAGGLKPWSFRTAESLRSVYYEYLDRTAFAGWRPAPSVSGLALSLYERSGLRSLVYPAENIGMRMIRRLSRRDFAAAGDAAPERVTREKQL